MVDVVARAVVGAGVGHAEGLLEADGDPGEVGAAGLRPGPGERIGEEKLGLEH